MFFLACFQFTLLISRAADSNVLQVFQNQSGTGLAGPWFFIFATFSRLHSHRYFEASQPPPGQNPQSVSAPGF